MSSVPLIKFDSKPSLAVSRLHTNGLSGDSTELSVGCPFGYKSAFVKPCQSLVARLVVIVATLIVHQYRRVTGEHIVRVDVADGEVAHGLSADVAVDPEHDQCVVVRSAKLIARGQMMFNREAGL
ncbi:hypothetical protein Drose_26600 [Dactylosporangium roseum]|uniref:Uncharacterized protein n=1 Tax=Dactylosporangium roseum TaxID=47989 RepID=A0ABY5Z0Z2_9ACTN|nr:hypothetical protein [Dactylosporangium roseum]UWZ34753.1 hypothetical protein Drose_26600 [Dactylosporangium roseum]